ncbi:hypothetical protein CAI21_14670 [Alkalilimnicola ehrlichii]|uniref:Uncharacterized protein n=1 Tax=Alkalilimnicola ehrlichii TaxID=351052 RepID=A0A3E0WN55_9GAMM|nr:hypothetical protein [Alkalilimnicola ehrlichii]RFA27284.1 hypothetical protein CAI21_14670 [Alkalilimnicola ehrlichii]RFA34394.1 hypothetical protein CAL65_15240 [Alkalilimnicola ehrlichii]
MSNAVKLQGPFYGFIRREAQTMRRSMPSQLEYLALLGYQVERKGLLSKEKIGELLAELPYDLLPPEVQRARLDAAFEELEDLPQNETLLADLKARGEPVSGVDSSGELIDKSL